MRSCAGLCCLPCWVLAWSLSAQALAAENWPAWRGPHGDGTSEAQDLPVVWNERHGLAWKAALPEWGTSTPAVWGDALFVTTQELDRLLLSRLDARTGQVVWTVEVGRAETPRTGPPRGAQKFHELQNNASPSPVTDGEIVVAHFGNGDLAAYDFDGGELWRHNLADEHGAYSIWWGHANSPVLHGDLVISISMQDSLAGITDPLSPSYLVAHDKRTGRERWKTMRMTEADGEECDSYTTPVPCRVGDHWELLVMGGNQLDAYDPATGKQLWFLPGLKGGRTITGPTAAHGVAYATVGMRGDLVAVPLGGQGELERRDVVWKASAATPDTPCPVVWRDLLFTVSDDGIACCYDAHRGHLKWKQRLPGSYKASPVAAEGRVYFLNMQGLATVVSASDRFERLARNQLDDETTASPAVAGGRIYIRGRKFLYAIEKK
ncbi:MAG: PQQ-binding-like beta-propeller repeat protein [Pirellulales bacterium]